MPTPIKVMIATTGADTKKIIWSAVFMQWLRAAASSSQMVSVRNGSQGDVR
jgi:hypothetical protein